MKLDRRQFIGATGLSIATCSAVLGVDPPGFRIGMCDWNLGKRCDPEDIRKAREAGLGGIQVSVAIDAKTVPLRDPKVRQRYLDLGKEHGVVFNSVAAGLLNDIPLKSEPQAAVFAIEALEAAAALGARNILLAFFAAGDLRVSIGEDQYKNVSTGAFKSYELDAPGVKRVTDVLRQLVPRAEALRVVIGIENTLTAEQNLQILDEVGSPIVQVYYDVGNSTHYGYDVPSEIRKLGNKRICEVHLKDWKAPLLGSPEGEVNFPEAAKACKEIGFDKWYVLETSGRKGKFIEDTKTNIEFARKLFG